MSGEAFDPEQHGFAYLPGHQLPGGVRCYEFRNHPAVDGAHDYRRLNVYLTRDGDFVTVWYGCLEPISVQAFLESNGIAPSRIAGATHEEPLFRGYIESVEQARHVLKALRLSRYIPQLLGADPEKRVICAALE